MSHAENEHTLLGLQSMKEHDAGREKDLSANLRKRKSEGIVSGGSSRCVYEVFLNEILGVCCMNPLKMKALM